MRLGRVIVLVVLIAIAFWVIKRTVSVQNSSDKLEITIDKQKLRETGREAVEEGKEAVGKAGRALERAGDKIEHKTPPEEPATSP